MTITFIGHSFVPAIDSIKHLIKEQVQNNIDDAESVICYIGGYGDFDGICAHVCRELKSEYKGLEIIYVTPYIGASEQKKIKEMQEYGLYDTFLYPPIENVPPRFAISKRNEWMIKNSELIIVYVDHNYGGAYKSFQFAKRNEKRIINICDLI